MDAVGVRNCAHLFALREGADAEVLLRHPDNLFQVQRDYASFGCLDEVSEGLLFTRKRLRNVDWIFMLGVEVSALHIPSIELPGLGAMRVVVESPSRLAGRMFSPSDFFFPIHDALEARVTLHKRFSNAEATALTAPLVKAARALRLTLGRTNGAAPFAPGQLEHAAWLEHWASSH